MGILGNILAIQAKWQAIDLTKEVAEILQDKEAELAEYNRAQLRAGKGADGKYLPLYRDDPYFKSPGAALRYENWKAMVSPNKDKPRGVMDFFITGYTHEKLFASVVGNKIDFGSTVPFESSINSKTPFAFGLNTESKSGVWAFLTRDELIIRIKTLTGAR